MINITISCNTYAVGFDLNWLWFIHLYIICGWNSSRLSGARLHYGLHRSYIPEEVFIIACLKLD